MKKLIGYMLGTNGLAFLITMVVITIFVPDTDIHTFRVFILDSLILGTLFGLLFYIGDRK